MVFGFIFRQTISFKITKKGEKKMKTVKDKYLVVGADFAGFPLKEVW